MISEQWHRRSLKWRNQNKSIFIEFMLNDTQKNTQEGKCQISATFETYIVHSVHSILARCDRRLQSKVHLHSTHIYTTNEYWLTVVQVMMLQFLFFVLCDTLPNGWVRMISKSCLLVVKDYSWILLIFVMKSLCAWLSALIVDLHIQLILYWEKK